MRYPWCGIVGTGLLVTVAGCAAPGALRAPGVATASLGELEAELGRLQPAGSESGAAVAATTSHGSALDTAIASLGFAWPAGFSLSTPTRPDAFAFEEEELATGEEAVDITQQDETGTDPRGFGNRIMPYYLYTKLENGMTINEFHAFGMVAFEQRVAFTYDWPLAKEIDYSRVREFNNGLTELPDGGGGQPGVGGAGFPVSELAPDGDEVGMGDLNMRLFVMPEAWDNEFEFGFGPKKGEQGSLNFMTGLEMTLPTATEDLLGGETWVISPLFTVVIDTPTFGFFAMMNFYDFDAVKDSDRPDVSRYRGRWFLMQPLSKPGPGVFDGIYLLPEFQPVYDFEEDHFSFWIGPEIGKMLGPGRIIYAKPGWGVSPQRSKGDRDITLEVGFRWFF